MRRQRRHRLLLLPAPRSLRVFHDMMGERWRRRGEAAMYVQKKNLGSYGVCLKDHPLL